MPSAPSPWVRRAFAAVLAGAALAVGAGRARAEEALVLDNGAVLRGNVVREDEGTVVLQLLGVGTDSRVTVARGHIVQRFLMVDPRVGLPGAHGVGASPSAGDPEVAAPLLRRADPVPVEPRGPVRPAATPAVPEEEPEARHETFFQRAARRAELAAPREAPARALLAALALAVLLCLVDLGGRMAEIQGLSLGRSTVLGLLLGGLVVIHVLWADTFLRADRAPLLLPLGLLAWVGCASGVLRCSLGRAFVLLGFVLLSGALVTFTTAAVLVTV